MKFITVSMMMIIFFWSCVYSVDESPTRSEASIDEAFQKWMLDFGRTYANTTEMNKRRQIFKEELEDIDKFNSQGNYSYTVGLNQFSDLTEEEWHSVSGSSYDSDPTIRGLSHKSYIWKYLEEDYFYIERSWYVDQSLKLSESEEASIDQEFQKWLLEDGWTYSRTTDKNGRKIFKSKSPRKQKRKCLKNLHISESYAQMDAYVSDLKDSDT